MDAADAKATGKSIPTLHGWNAPQLWLWARAVQKGCYMNDLVLWTDPEEVERFRVAIDARTKHADLWPLAKSMGSGAELGRKIGVDTTTISQWIGLRSIPNPKHPKHAKAMDELLVLIGKGFDELWPLALREAIYSGVARRRETILIQTTAEMMGRVTAERLTQQAPPQIAEGHERDEQVRRAMSRLRPRMKLILEMSLDGMTLKEIGKEVKVCVARARQLLEKAKSELRTELERLPDFMAG